MPRIDFNSGGGIVVTPITEEEARRYKAIFRFVEENEFAIRHGQLQIEISFAFNWRPAGGLARPPAEERKRLIVPTGLGIAGKD